MGGTRLYSTGLDKALQSTCLDQRGPAQEDGPIPAHYHCFIRHCRHIGAPCRARPHHHCHLGNALRRHAGLVEEDPALQGAWLSNCRDLASSCLWRRMMSAAPSQHTA